MRVDLVAPTDSSPAVAGTARLRFARCGERTILDRSFATSPVKMFTTRATEGTCWVCSATLGGGFVGGDAVRMSVEVGPGARAVIATQASTKVYRSLRPTSQHVIATIDDDALLVSVPDPIVCYAGAHFSQEQRYDLGARGNLVLVDWMTSGRHAVGERWAFRHYASRIDVRRQERRLLYDAILLSESDGAIGERLGPFEVCLTTVVSGPLLSAAAATIVREAAARGIDKHATLVMAAWPLADGGALLRMSGMSVEQVGAALREQLAFLPGFLGDDPWSRKW